MDALFFRRLKTIVAMKFQELDPLSKRFAILLALVIGFYLVLIGGLLAYFIVTGDYSPGTITSYVLATSLGLLGVIVTLWVCLCLVPWQKIPQAPPPPPAPAGYTFLLEEEMQP